MRESKITLGWKVNDKLQPIYWLGKNPKPGLQNSKTDLISIPSSKVAEHTVIIAQSGSGKSFLLGRLIEEIALQTKANCLIIDPNGDYRKIYKVDSEELWTSANFNKNTNTGKLPTEKTSSSFEAKWKKISKRILHSGLTNEDPLNKNFTIWWSSIPIESLSEGHSPMVQNKLYHYHRFINAILPIAYFGLLINGHKSELISALKNILKRINTESFKDVKDIILNEFSINLESDLMKVLANGLKIPMAELAYYKDLAFMLNIPFSYAVGTIFANLRIKLKEACTLAGYVKYDEDVLDFYCSLAEEYRSRQIVITDLQKPIIGVNAVETGEVKIEVLDLPSFKDPLKRQIAISTLLDFAINKAHYEWEEAMAMEKGHDQRVPKFLIIDEAHNIIPKDIQDSRQESIRNKIRQIAAEGRKYGLFLIILSQRPDKLDNHILSECNNQIIMKISSKEIKRLILKTFSSSDIDKEKLARCINFNIGQGLLTGKWVSGISTFFYTASRRTVEGGRNLQKEYWAIPDRKAH